MAKRTVADTVLDPTVKYATLEIDGTSFKLAYDFNAIAEAEKVAGCNLLLGLAKILISGADASQIRGLLYAALRKAQPKMTIDDAGTLIRIDNLVDIQNAILEAYRLSMPEAKKNEDPTEAGPEPARASA